MPERVIVKYGVYQFSEEEKTAYRLRVYTQVIRQPSNQSLNTKYQKHQSFYGYAQLMDGDFVHRTIQLQYEKECIFEYIASDSWNTLVTGSYQYGIILTVSNAVVALGGSPLVLVEPSLPLFPMAFDRIVFKLFNNTTLAVFTEVLNFPELPNVASEFDTLSDEPPEPSSTAPEENPEDEGFDIPTLPYDPATDDGGETYDPPRPEPVYTGQFECTVTFTNPVIAPGNIVYVNTLTDPAPAPVREETTSGSSKVVALRWYYGSSGQYWQIDYTSAGQDITDQIQIVSSSLAPI